MLDGMIRLPGKEQSFVPSCSINLKDPSRKITQINSFPFTPPKLPLQKLYAGLSNSC